MTGSPSIFTHAVRHWWASKNKNQADAGETQAGTRGANLRGDTMDGFRIEIRERLISAGISPDDIFWAGRQSALASNLPSYFRAAKNWDLVVCKNSLYKRLEIDTSPSVPMPQLIAAIEFKSQQGSVGKNQYNRMEESLGSATDFWAAYECGSFGSLQPRPWLGYVFVACFEDEDIDRGVEINQPHFLTDPIFEGRNPAERLSQNKYVGPSYPHRYRIFMERLIAKKLYDAGCLIVTSPSLSGAAVNHKCLFPELSGERFVDLLVRHVKAYYPD